MMGLSGAIGFEVFVLLDYAYFNLAGPYLVLALLLAGIMNLFIMFSYCELGAFLPLVGGEYTYIKAAFGGYLAFISGCFRWFASVFGAALAAICFTQQLAYLFSFVTPIIENFIISQASMIAFLLVVIFMLIEIRGMKELGSAIIVVLLFMFAIFIGGGLLSVNIPFGSLRNLIPQNLTEMPRIFGATIYLFPMFFGMRAIVSSAPLVKNPQKNIPRGMVVAGLAIIPIYIGLALLGTVLVSSESAPSTPFLNFAVQQILGVGGGILFAIVGMVACLSSLGTALTVQSSIARGMSRDGYLPKIFQVTHNRFNTYYMAIIFGSLFIMFFSTVGPVEYLGYAASFGSIVVFALVNFSLIKLRQKMPYVERPFRIPLYPVLPIVGILLCVIFLGFPMLLGDMHAIDALFSGVILVALVLMIYYLRMVGRQRIQVAMGGASLGIGIILFIYLILSEILVTPMQNTMKWSMFLMSAISIIAGVLNIIVND